MSKPGLLLLGRLQYARKEWEAFGSFAKLKELNPPARNQFFGNCDNGEYDNVVAIYRANEHDETGRFDAELVNHLPKSVKFLCGNGAGYDKVDVSAFTSRKIGVSHTPTVVDNATADATIFLMIGALRRIHPLYTAIRNSEWMGSNSKPGHDPEGKLLGILGMGGIGRQVAKRARAFGMTIQYHNRHRLPPELEEDAKYVSFEELVRTSDVLSLNLGLNEQTRGIIGRKEFGMMKEGVVLVNTARGAVMDEQALVDALEEGKVWAAGLDVFANEPEVHQGLLKNENVVLLPHVGSFTLETERAMELLVLENMKSAVQKGRLVTQVPEQR